MKTISFISSALFFLLFSSIAFAQQDVAQILKTYLQTHREELNVTEADVANFEITDNTLSKHNGVRHVHIAQQINGLPLKNGVANFTLNARNEVVFVGNRLVSNIAAQLPASATPALTPARAIKKAADHVKMSGNFGQQISQPKSNKYVFEKGSLAKEDIAVTLAYWKLEEGIELVWIVSLYQKNGEHWWQVFVNAATGETVDLLDWVVSCEFDEEADHTQADVEISLQKTSKSFKVAAAGLGQYNVFALPVESPNHGSRSVKVSPADTLASPHGWHDTNGIAGAEFTTTRGNNVFAYTDDNGDDVPNFVPNGGTNLNFNFSLNLAQQPSGYQNVAVTNLFYTCNRIHDIFYRYGFDEANGNFQANNYGKGGLDNDYVFAEAQDGSGMNNANFSTPTDGQNGRMQMFIWTGAVSSNLLTVNSPTGVAGPYAAAEATFGPGLTLTPITANVVLVNDGSGDSADACQTILNTAAINGKIAILYRGSCTFADKVQRAQTAGAIAVIIVNNVPGLMAPGGSSATVTIPSVMISQVDGNAIVASLKAGNTVNATLVADSLGAFDLDGDFDNGIIVHEYAHGISIRLAGGPSNSNCLDNDEQMGEGWSDFFATMLTMDTNVANPVHRPMATYANGEAVNGIGIRNAPYDTNFAVNNYTYADVADVANVSMPHGIGFVWATMLWDLNWAFINQYGYDANIDSGNGGNNLLLQLVVDGLTLQPCNPGFVDARDAILLADQLNNNGANQCLIWKAFAKRGLGYSATQGSTNNRSDQVEAYDLPPLCMIPVTQPTANFSANNTLSCNGTVRFKDLSTNIPQAWLWLFGDGNSDSAQNPVHTYSLPGTYTVTLIVSNTLGTDTAINANFITITIPSAPTAFSNGSGCSSDSIVLTASGNSTIGWFNANNDLLATGSTFNAPPTLATTTYFVRNGVVFPSLFVGPADTSIGTGANHNTSFTGTINFDAFDDITIHSAWVKSGSAGPRTVTLWDGYDGVGNVVEVRTIDVPFAGAGRVDLGFTVPGPGTYSLGLAQADLYRSASGVNYPYSISGLMSITGSPAGADRYYYFYDVEVSKTPCWSDSVAVTATVTDTADFSYTNASFTYSFTDLSPGATSWAWNFGDGNTSTQQNPTHTYAQAGIYTVTLSINGGTCIVTYKVNVGGIGILEEVGNGFAMSLYPNPAKTELHIDFNAALKSSGKISLYTLQGQLVRKQSVAAGEKGTLILLDGLASDLYILELEVEEGHFYQKVLIAK